jgi:hypothetical protein
MQCIINSAWHLAGQQQETVQCFHGIHLRGVTVILDFLEITESYANIA